MTDSPEKPPNDTPVPQPAVSDTKTAESISTPHSGVIEPPPVPKSNLRPPWQRGQSGNPKGKPKGTPSITTALKRFMNLKQKVKNPLNSNKEETLTVADRLALRLIVKAVNGDRLAINDIANRLEGSPLTRLGGPNGEPLPAAATMINFDNLTDDELRRLANHGRSGA